MKKKINNSWDEFFIEETNKDYFKSLENFVDKEYKEKVIFPKEEDLFNAFKLTPLENIKVVILGQDPYHNYNEAMGLSFSVRDGIKFPPSLVNIFKELKDDIGIDIPKSGDLTKLAKEGIFLLNTTLTVEHNKPLSHFGYGWETFTDNVIKYINNIDRPICYILWGNNARRKKSLITNKKHFVIEGVHPSPLSAYNGFFGSKPFSRANMFLMDHEIEPIYYGVLNEA